MRYHCILFFVSSLTLSQPIIEPDIYSINLKDTVVSNPNIIENLKGEIIEGRFSLHQNYPNPFNPSTIISYEIKVTSYIELKIYDAMGRFIKTADEGIKIPGSYKISFQPENLSSGIYFYRLISGEYVTQNKMLLLK